MVGHLHPSPYTALAECNNAVDTEVTRFQIVQCKVESDMPSVQAMSHR